MTHRSWTGKQPALERLCCRVCGQEFSERAGPLMADSKLPEATVARLLTCQRWGVCDAGTADICAVDRKTVQRFQRVAARRAEDHHRPVVHHVDGAGGPLEEAHSKLRRKQVAWSLTALAMGSRFLLWGEVGTRTQQTAAGLMAQVVARLWTLPLWLTAGWKGYPAALLQVVGVVSRPRRRGRVGRNPKARLVAPRQLL